MKKLLSFLVLANFAFAMQQPLKPTPNLPGLPTELKKIIFEGVIQRDPSIAATPEMQPMRLAILKHSY